jgi:hypothetical protein
MIEPSFAQDTATRNGAPTEPLAQGDPQETQEWLDALA